MSIMIKCDGNDNCQNFDGCCDKRVFPVSKEIRNIFPNVEHLCLDCLESDLNESNVEFAYLDVTDGTIKLRGVDE